MKMAYLHDPMLAEIRQIRRALWEESKHDFHTMLQIIEQEAKEIMSQYGKVSTTLSESDVSVADSATREIIISNY